MFQHLFSGVGQAIQPIVSTNFGAGHSHRIHEVDRLSIATVLLMGIAFTLAGLLFPTQITKFFMSTTPEILEIAPGIIRIYFLSFLPMGINIQATYYLQSVMQTTRSIILSLLRGLMFSGILIYVLPIWWGINGVWWGMVFAEFAVVIITLISLNMVDKANTGDEAQ